MLNTDNGLPGSRNTETPFEGATGGLAGIGIAVCAAAAEAASVRDRSRARAVERFMGLAYRARNYGVASVAARISSEVKLLTRRAVKMSALS